MADTRYRIIVATNELFRHHAYNGTSLKQISEISGATIGSIYHFFPGGKEALAVEVIATTGAVYRELLESIIADANGPARAYADFFDGAAAVLVETNFIDPCPIGTVAREVASTSEPIRLAASSVFASWARVASDHLRGAGISTVIADQLATMFVATVEGAFVLSRTHRSVEPLAAAGRVISSLVEQASAETSSVVPW
jgi:AcrR family transcriptional regulator